jgi:RNA-directed DNA polymerase
MKALKVRIEDKLILSLIESWLKKGSATGCFGKSSRKGLFQGGIISPLLLNFYLDQFDNRWAEIGLKNVEGDSVEHLVRFADDFVILSKEWIDQGRVEAVLAVLGLKLNKEKTYVGAAENGFEFVGFYFQKIADENGIKRGIRVIPTEGSIEKIIESIDSIKKSRSVDVNETQSTDGVINNIYKVVDPWVNYYKHTDYAAGLERIEQSFNKKIREFIKIHTQ